MSISISRLSAGRCKIGMIAAATALIGIVASPLATAQTNESAPFPSRPLQIIAPFPAGAATDFAARLIGQQLASDLGVPVVVENKTGASGTIAADAVVNGSADGQQLLLGTLSLVTQPELTGRPTYVPQQLEPLGVAVDMQLVLVAKPEISANNIAELLAEAKANPGVLKAASAGQGTLSHLGWEIVRQQTGSDLQHVPYRGSAPAMTDLMAGHTDVMIDTVTSALPHLSSGKIKALAVLTPERLAILPNVPTATEQGYPWLGMSAWNAFMVPANTPADRQAKLHEALKRAAQQPDVQKSLSDRGLDVVIRPPAEHREFVLQEQDRWTRLIREAGVKP